MVVWYVVSTILIVLGAFALIWGVYLMYCGIRHEDPWGDFFRGVRRLSLAAISALMLWAIGFPWDGGYFEWLKTFVAANAAVLNIIGGVIFLVFGIPLLFIIIALIKWFLVDTGKKTDTDCLENGNEREN